MPNISLMSEDILLTITKTLSISDLFKLCQSNTRFRKIILSEKGIRFYCFHNKIIFPLETDINYLITILKGHFYFLKSEETNEQLLATSTSLQSVVKKHELELAMLYQELQPVDNVWGIVKQPTKEQSESLVEVNSLTTLLKEQKEKYDESIKQAIANGSLIALITSIQARLSTFKGNNIENCTTQIESFELEIDGFKKSYGATAELFLTIVYYNYVSLLLMEKDKARHPAQALLNKDTQKLLGIYVPTKECYREEISKTLVKMEKTLLSFSNNKHSVQHFSFRIIVNLCKIEGIKVLDDIIKELSNFINEQLQKPIEQYPMR